jgi:nucleoid-associated protein YgaU
MPERRTVQKARKDKRAGKSTTTQAGEFVHEEIRKVRRGEHGARSPQQAIAIGLSKARRAGVALRPPTPRQRRAKAPNTPMKRARASGSPSGGRASRVR